MMDSRRNFPEKRIIPLLVLRKYIVPSSEPRVFTRIKNDLKEVEGRFYPRGEAFCHEPIDKAPRVRCQGAGQNFKNLKNSI